MKRNSGHRQVQYVYKYRMILFSERRKCFFFSPQGWTWHLGTIVSAWILTSALLIYMLTLIIDFRRIKIISPKIFLTDDIVDE